MRTFAQVNEDNIVINIAVFADDQTPDEGVDLGLSNWYETADNIRKNVASPGSTFVPEADGYPSGLFHPPSPHNTWVLDENYEWQPPADKPYPEGFGTKGSLWWWDDLIDEWDQKTYMVGFDVTSGEFIESE